MYVPSILFGVSVIHENNSFCPGALPSLAEVTRQMDVTPSFRVTLMKNHADHHQQRNGFGFFFHFSHVSNLTAVTYF